MRKDTSRGVVSYKGARLRIKYKGCVKGGCALTMGVASCLSVMRGDFLRTTSIGSMQFVCCPGLRGVCPWEVTY